MQDGSTEVGEIAWTYHAGLSSDKLSQPFGQGLK